MYHRSVPDVKAEVDLVRARAGNWTGCSTGSGEDVTQEVGSDRGRARNRTGCSNESVRDITP